MLFTEIITSASVNKVLYDNEIFEYIKNKLFEFIHKKLFAIFIIESIEVKCLFIFFKRAYLFIKTVSQYKILIQIVPLCKFKSEF